MSSLLFTLVILEWIVTTKFSICTNPVSFVGAFQQFPPKQKLIIKSQQQLLNDERKRRRRMKVTTKFRIFKMIFSAMFVYLQLFETTTKRNFLHFKSSFESSQTLKYLIIGFFHNTFFLHSLHIPSRHLFRILIYIYEIELNCIFLNNKKMVLKKLI